MSELHVAPGGSSVLEDPTGRRARWLRRAGRLVFVLFLVWLVAIVLGGLGLVPVPGILGAHVLRPAQGPPVLTRLPKPAAPPASDLRPALTAQAFAATRARKKATPAASTPHGQSATAPGQTKTTTTTTHGKGARGKSALVHGKTKTTTTTTSTTTTTTTSGNGKSTLAPGQAHKP